MQKFPLLIGLFLSMLLIILIHFNGFTESIDRIMIRITAKLSFILFVISFSISALHYFFKAKWSAYILKYRRQIGLSFAVSHTFHLLFILLLQFYFDAQNFEERGVFTVLGGGLAYLFLYLMTITSTNQMVEILGIANWKKLHSVGAYYIMIVFSVSYIPRAFVDFTYVPYALIIIVLLIIKFAYISQKKV